MIHKITSIIDAFAPSNKEPDPLRNIEENILQTIYKNTKIYNDILDNIDTTFQTPLVNLIGYSLNNPRVVR